MGEEITPFEHLQNIVYAIAQSLATAENSEGVEVGFEIKISVKKPREEKNLC